MSVTVIIQAVRTPHGANTIIDSGATVDHFTKLADWSDWLVSGNNRLARDTRSGVLARVGLARLARDTRGVQDEGQDANDGEGEEVKTRNHFKLC